MQWAERTEFEPAETDLDAVAARHRADGKPLIDLTVSNPTRCGFDYDAEALLPPLAGTANLAYAADPLGPLHTRQAIAERYYGQRSIALSPDRLMLTSSTSEAYGYLFRLLCNPGDQVLVPTPSYPLFDLLARLNDVELLHYPLHRHDGWSIDMQVCERLISSRTRAIIVVHPNNPTGHFISSADEAAIYDLARRHSLAVIADEVFLDYALQGEPTSFLGESAPALTFVLSGLSKVLALPQMKLAWTAVHGPDELCEQAMHRLEIVADTFLPISLPIANAAPEWLRSAVLIQEQIRARVSANLALLDEALTNLPLLTRLPVKAGWSVLLRMPALHPDTEVTRELLDRHGVLVHPGSFYGFPPSGYLVISLLVPRVSFAAGVNSLVTCIDELVSRESKETTLPANL